MINAIWKTGDERYIKVNEMSAAHLCNALKKVHAGLETERKIPKTLLEEVGSGYDNVSYQEWINIFTEEWKRRELVKLNEIDQQQRDNEITYNAAVTALTNLVNKKMTTVNTKSTDGLSRNQRRRLNRQQKQQ